jgi:hypothetical protein
MESKTKLNSIWVHIDTQKRDKYNLLKSSPIKTTLKPDGYNVYIGAVITWNNKKYLVIDRINDLPNIYLLVIKKM